MITEKTRKEIVDLSAEPLMDWIKDQAVRGLQQVLCEPRCGEVWCDAPCPMALRLLERVTRLVWLWYARTN